MIERVVIEYNYKCPICHYSVPDIIKILKKHGIPYVLKAIGDDYPSTYEFHQIQPSLRSMYQNLENIQNPDLKEFLEKGHPLLLMRFDTFLQSSISAPRIYIYMKGGTVIVINGVVLKEDWFEKFEDIIKLLNNLENLGVILQMFIR